MVVKLKTLGKTWSVDRAGVSSPAVGDLIGTDKSKINASYDKPLGILLDTVPTNNPPEMLDVYGQGTIFEDTGITSSTLGTLVYSDGDGTYSVTKPSVSAGQPYWALGTIRRTDATSSDIEIDIQLVEDGA